MALYTEPPTNEYEGIKLKILQKLWNGDWVLTSDLIPDEQRVNYPRRLRELQNDGWDIEIGPRTDDKGDIRTAFHLRSHVRERKEDNPKSVIPDEVSESVERISQASPSDIQEIAASQIKLLSVYHNLVLEQARRSFYLAMVAACVGLVFFIAAITVLWQRSEGASIISLLSGAIVEVIAGINFYLYGKTSNQLADFQIRLDMTQRFLLANSICEGLDGNHKQRARTILVKAVAGVTEKQSPLPKEE